MTTNITSINKTKMAMIHLETPPVERKVGYLSPKSTHPERCDHSTGTMLNRHDHSPNSNKQKRTTIGG